MKSSKTRRLTDMYNTLLIVMGLLPVVVMVVAMFRQHRASVNTILNDGHLYVWGLFGIFLVLLGTYIKDDLGDGKLVYLLLLGIIIVIERRLKDITDKLANTVEKLNDTNKKLDDISLHEAYLVQTNAKLQELVGLFMDE